MLLTMPTLAQTILLQIGHRTLQELNANDYVYTATGIVFFVSRHRSGPKTKVSVNLDPTDTYTVEITRLGADWLPRSLYRSSDIYADNLREVITMAVRGEL